MKVLKNRTIAVFLALVLVIGSTLISASAKLKADIKKVTDGFYTNAIYVGDGLAMDGDASESIYKQLTVITGEADKIYAIAAANDLDAEAVKEASYYLKSNLSSMHEYIGSIYWSYSELCDALTSLKPKLAGMLLTQSERDEVNGSYLVISDAQKIISESGYNESVRRYKSSMNTFTELVADICDIYGPEFFS